MKVVLDANIFVSFFLTRHPTITKIFSAWYQQKITVFVSPEIKAEILRVFQYPKLLLPTLLPTPGVDYFSGTPKQHFGLAANSFYLINCLPHQKVTI